MYYGNDLRIQKKKSRKRCRENDDETNEDINTYKRLQINILNDLKRKSNNPYNSTPKRQKQEKIKDFIGYS